MLPGGQLINSHGLLKTAHKRRWILGIKPKEAFLVSGINYSVIKKVVTTYWLPWGGNRHSHAS